jgi:hypothetical protein
LYFACSIIAWRQTIKVHSWFILRIGSKFKYINHVLTYAGLVCPDVIEGNYIKELNDSFGLNICDEEILNNVSEETKNQILEMTKQVV